MRKSLPNYAERLDALHRALERDFQRLLEHIPLRGDELILDAGCGDGFFTSLLAERITTGEVVALDSSKLYLKEVEDRLDEEIEEGTVTPAQGDVLSLPFDDASFDVVFSAHSMQSYPSVEIALREFHRVLKEGATLAILESDNLHSLILPWAPEFELELREAEQSMFRENAHALGAYFPRRAWTALEEAGFEPVTRENVLIERTGTSDDALERYIRLYLEDISERLGERLSTEMLRQAERYAEPDSDQYLPRQKGFYFASLQSLFLAHGR